jgi:hypothetical protein
MSRPASLSAFFFLAAASCSADTLNVYFTNLPATYQYGTYNGYAAAAINGIPNQYLICDDYAGDTVVPSPRTMIYDYSVLTGPNVLQYAMWGATPSAVVKYEEAAVLLFGLAQAGPNAAATTISDYQYALWNLMDPTAPLASGRSTQELALQSAALAMVGDASEQQFLSTAIYPSLKIYTPTAAFAGNQEFLQFVLTPVPEPSGRQLLTCILTACLIVFFVTRRAARK